MSNKKETKETKESKETNNFKSKYHENRFNKKNKQSDIRNKRNNKNFFQYEDSIVNELPSGSFDRNNKVYPEIIEQVNEENICHSKELLDFELVEKEEYEEYTPDYFEPQVYKK